MDRERSPVSGTEQAQVARALLAWLNTSCRLPRRVDRIEAEYLSNGACMGLFTAAAPVKTREFINGAYEAQFQFSLQYRTAPACSEQRLDAMETLSALADWAEENDALPDLGGAMSAVCVERSSPAVMAARYDDGCEDYQILMVLTYQVKP